MEHLPQAGKDIAKFPRMVWLIITITIAMETVAQMVWKSVVLGVPESAGFMETVRTVTVQPIFYLLLNVVCQLTEPWTILRSNCPQFPQDACQGPTLSPKIFDSKGFKLGSFSNLPQGFFRLLLEIEQLLFHVVNPESGSLQAGSPDHSGKGIGIDNGKIRKHLAIQFN